MSKRWYLIYTKPKQEHIASDNLINQNFEVYLPLLEHLKRRRNKNVLVTEPLFPRYLFIQLDLGNENISTIRSTFGVSKLVSFGVKPAPVPIGFVESLQDAEDAQKRVHISDDHHLKLGDTIEILNGPFAGHITKIHALKGADRVCVLLDILGSENRIELPSDTVTRI